MITKAVRQILVNANIAGGRVYAGRAPDNEPTPYVRINQTMVPERCHEGIGMKIYSVQIDIYSRKYAEVASIAETLIDLLDGFTGVVQDIDIRDATFTDESNGFSDDTDYEEKILEFDFNVNI